MGLTNKLKDLKDKAQETAVERSEQIHGAVQKAKETADRQTGGKYHEQIQKAGAKADKLVEDLKNKQPSSKAQSDASSASSPPPPASFRD